MNKQTIQKQTMQKQTMHKQRLQQRVDAIADQFPARWQVTTFDGLNGVAFPHFVIDNFFTDDEFAAICAKEKAVAGKEVNMAHSLIRKDGEIKSNTFDDEFLTKIDQSYRPYLLQFLAILSSNKTKLYEYSDFHLISTGPDYQHAIHDDIPKKLLSVVVYMAPEKNHGTFIHPDRNTQEPAGEVQWQRNRAFVFSRKDRKTWHSYSANGKANRFCVVYNLNTYKAFKAHWAEGNFLKFLEKGIKYE
ncbi:hypothetical protein [Halioxenophilus sp. WMMB6]|uniref:hypothetical protein n=1 Tax=Halioxenophilus sp. WMMB6 TaxID=3073815 RepID=UPI00295EC014|nr:hypothetical protein [Halioxenophilus sp. WMMB6]